MPSFVAPNEILIWRQRLVFPSSIPRNIDWKRWVETYDLTGLFPAPGLSGFQVNGNTIAPIAWVINLPVSNDVQYVAWNVKWGWSMNQDTTTSGISTYKRTYLWTNREVWFVNGQMVQIIPSNWQRNFKDWHSCYWDNPVIATPSDVLFKNNILGWFSWFVNGPNTVTWWNIKSWASSAISFWAMKIDKNWVLWVYKPVWTAAISDHPIWTAMVVAPPYAWAWRSVDVRWSFSNGAVIIRNWDVNDSMGSPLLTYRANRFWSSLAWEWNWQLQELDNMMNFGWWRNVNLAWVVEPSTAVPTYSRFLTTRSEQNNNDNDHQIIINRQETSVATWHSYAWVKTDGTTPKDVWFRARSYTGQLVGTNAQRPLFDIDTGLWFAVTAVNTATTTVYTPSRNDVVIEVNLTTAWLLFTPHAAAWSPRRLYCLKITNTSAINNIIVQPLAWTIEWAATLTIRWNRKSHIWIYSNWTEWKTLMVDEWIRVQNTLFVDATYWNNITAQRESFDKPFSTMVAAEAAALAWDTIVIRPSTLGFWALWPTKNINFMAMPWVNINSWFLQVNDWIEVNFLWDADVTHPWINNMIRVWGTFRFNFNKVTNNWTVLVTNANQPILANMKVIWKIREGISTWWWQQLLFNFNVWWAWVVDIQNPYVDVEVSSLKNIWLINITNKCSWWTFIWKYDIADFRWTGNSKIFQIDASNGLNVNSNHTINIKWWHVYWSTSIWTTSALHLVQWMLSSSIWYFHADTYYWSNSFFADNWSIPWNEWIMWWNKHESIDKSLYAWYQSNVTWLSVTKWSVIKNNVIECITSWSPAAWWASVATPAVVFIVWQWMSYISTSKIHRSTQYWIWWVDNQAVAWVNNNYTWAEISFYWTKLSCNNTFWANWMLYTDEWVSANTHPDIIYNFYAWCVFDFVNTATPAWLVWNWADTTLTNTRIYFWDDVVTNRERSVSPTVDEVVWQNNPSKIITAWWTYTINYNETDLYYDLALLWNLTIIVWDPALYKNMEFDLKIISTSPTNNVIIDPVWAALIDWSPTFTVPQTNTKRTSVTIKSIWTQWVVKSIY